MRYIPFRKQLSHLRNAGLRLTSAELRAIGRVLREATRAQGTGSAEEDLFIHRYLQSPRTLQLAFWENHFELDSFKIWPEIRGRVLDFGCGSGHLDLFLARRGHIIHGVDMSKTRFRSAMRTMPRITFITSTTNAP